MLYFKRNQGAVDIAGMVGLLANANLKHAVWGKAQQKPLTNAYI